MTSINKICTVCKSEKDINLFYSYFSKSRNKTRYDSKCKECKKKENRLRLTKYYKENKEDRLLYAANYRANNKKKLSIKRAKYRKLYIGNLQDCYVNEQLCKVLKVKGSEVEIPKEITEAYKLNLLIKRKIKDGKK
jgi:hypothetical protein